MADRYCPSCGTEVDADARFCPTCGITLDDDAQPELPAAPAWPQREPAHTEEGPGAPDVTGDAAGGAHGAETVHVAAAPEEASPAPQPEAVPAPEPGPAALGPPLRMEPAQPVPPAPPAEAGIDLPFTWPTTLSGWLIGVGSGVGAIALIPRLGDLVSVLLFLALLGVAASIFLAERTPRIPRLRLITLVVTTIGLGIALDRSAFAVRGLETILLLAMLAAAGGALLIELDRDRPMPPPARAGG